MEIKHTNSVNFCDTYIMSLNKLYFLLIIGMTINEIQSDPAGEQLVMYKNETQCCAIGTWTTSTGAPMEYSDTRTLNKNLLTNNLFLETILPFVRERIPERIIHTKGAGAFGYFEVTDDVTDICKADFLNKVGKRTKVAVRFSLSNGDKSTPDTSIDARGFAVKFYTDQGNFDIVGLNSETFLFKDPIFFTTEIRSFGRNPATNLKDPTMMWDFLTLREEIMNTFLFTSISNPDGYQHMPGFAIHTYQIENKQGDIHFVRFRIIPDQGIKNLTKDEASKIASEDPDRNSRKLYNDIANSNFPSWTVSVQVFNMSDVTKAGSDDMFDITKRISLEKFPPRHVGRITLNKNAINYYAQVESLAFNPHHVVPGIDGGVDSMFQVRGIVYNSAQDHRLGSNFNKIPVNCPLREFQTYLRDGPPPVDDNMKDAPNYYPNSFNGPAPLKEKIKQEIFQIHEYPPNNTEQARDFYLYGISEGERKVVIDNLIQSLSPVPKFIQDRALSVFKSIDQGLGSSVQKGLQEANNKK